MRRKRLPPDTRPKWDDPDLPVLYYGKEMLPSDLSSLCSWRVNTPTERNPDWHNDPAYHWRKKPQNTLSPSPHEVREGRE